MVLPSPAAHTPAWLALVLAGCSSMLGYDDVSFEHDAAGAGGQDGGAVDSAAGGAGGFPGDASHEGGGGGTAGTAGSAGAGGAAGSAGTGSGGTGTGGTAGSGAPCPDGVCSAGEDCTSCPQDCGACPVAEPDQLVGIHFWDDAATTELGAQPYYDVEAFESATAPSTIVTWLVQREASGARGIIRIDYQWGHSVPSDAGQRDAYSQRLVGIARAVHDAGLKTHHYVLGNESNLPWEGAATAQQVGEAYASARAALAASGPWSTPPLLLTTPPSTAAEYGGGDGTYLQSILNDIKARSPVDGIAIHAYENADSGGTANLFIATVKMQMTAIQGAGLAGLPVFVTEMNIDINQAGDAAGATFVQNAYARLNAWNQGGEGNPLPGKLVVAAGCWFVWHDDGNWGHLALNTASHPQTRQAFRSAMQAGYGSAWPQ